MIRHLEMKQAAKLHNVRHDPQAFHLYVVELREQGVTYQAIADELGTSRQWVHKVSLKGKKALTEAENEAGTGTGMV